MHLEIFRIFELMKMLKEFPGYDYSVELTRRILGHENWDHLLNVVFGKYTCPIVEHGELDVLKNIMLTYKPDNIAYKEMKFRVDSGLNLYDKSHKLVGRIYYDSDKKDFIFTKEKYVDPYEKIYTMMEYEMYK